MKHHTHLFTRIFNTPLMILPEKLEVIADVVLQEKEFRQSVDTDIVARNAEYQVVEGVAIIPIIGSLVHRGGMVEAQSGIVSYQQITKLLYQAVYDDEVRGIMLDVDSPGGEVDGCFTLVDEIVKIKKVKPVWAIARDMACSAAYAICSACDYIAMSDTAIAGSIGVVMAHSDVSEMMRKEGIKMTLIHAGRHKVLGNSYAPLSDEDYDTLLSAVGKIHSKFVRVVADNRGMSEDAVRATEAATYIGYDALRVGLVDRIGNPHEILDAFIAGLNGGNNIMIRNKKAESKPIEAKEIELETTIRPLHNSLNEEVLDESGVKRERGNVSVDKTTCVPRKSSLTPDSPKEALCSGLTDDIEAVKLEAISDERERISSILTSEHANGRESQAQHLAFKTNMDAATAIEMLAVSEKKLPPSPINKLDQAMSKLENPVIGNDLSDEEKPTGKSLVKLMNQRKL